MAGRTKIERKPKSYRFKKGVVESFKTWCLSNEMTETEALESLMRLTADYKPVNEKLEKASEKMKQGKGLS